MLSRIRSIKSRFALIRPKDEWMNIIWRLSPWIILLANSAFLGYLSIMRYYTFTDAWDLGTFSQAMWSATQGDFFLHTTEPFFAQDFPEVLVKPYFATHFMPFLYLLLPFYLVVPRPETLLALQSLGLALGGLPIYWLVSEKFNNRFLASAFQLVYMFYPTIMGIGLNSFHPEAFMVPLMLFAFYYGIRGSWVRYSFFAILVCSTLEYASILIIFLNLYLLLSNRKLTRRALVIFALSGIALITYAVIASEVRVLFGFDPAGLTTSISERAWRTLGARSVMDIPLAMVRNPTNAFNALATDYSNKAIWLVSLLVPVLFLPLFHPRGWIIGAPWLVIALFSDRLSYYYLYNFHLAFVVFFIFPSAIYGFETIISKPKRFKYGLALLTTCLLSFVAFAIPPSVYGATFTITPHITAKHEILALVPYDDTLLITSDMFPYVADRLHVYMVPPVTVRPEYDVISILMLERIDPEWIVFDLRASVRNVQAQNAVILQEKVYNSTDYGLYAYKDGVTVLKKDYKTEPVIFESDLVFDCSRISYFVWILKVSDSQFDYVLSSAAMPMDKEVFWFGPYIPLFSGNYTLKVNLKVERTVAWDAPVIDIDVAYSSGSKSVMLFSLYGANFTDSYWHTFTFDFSLDKHVFDAEFRGFIRTRQTPVYFQRLEVG